MCTWMEIMHSEGRKEGKSVKIRIDKRRYPMYNANKLQQNIRRVEEKSTIIKVSTESCRLVRGIGTDDGKYISEQ